MFNFPGLLGLFLLYLVARDRFKLYSALVDGAWDKLGAGIQSAAKGPATE